MTQHIRIWSWMTSLTGVDNFWRVLSLPKGNIGRLIATILTCIYLSKIDFSTSVYHWCEALCNYNGGLSPHMRPCSHLGVRGMWPCQIVHSDIQPEHAIKLHAAIRLKSSVVALNILVWRRAWRPSNARTSHKNFLLSLSQTVEPRSYDFLHAILRGKVYIISACELRSLWQSCFIII